MPDLRIGHVGKKAFTLPLEVATQAMSIHGVRGKGKTVTATVIVEELLERGVQVVVIDPTDSWWGLKSSADGTKPGYPVVILGGPRGDLPLTGASGRVIADFVVERGASMILSLRHLRKGEARHFVTDFAEQLFHRKGEPEHRTPLFLVIDECSQFVPQRVMGESARMVGAIQDCVRMGRNVGLGVALIDQRPATVNKDVLTQVELLACHAVTSPQDRKALDEWIRGHDSAGRGPEFLEGLASLGKGEAWFWFPVADVFERVGVRMRETFDSSRTPKLGERTAAPERTAEIDLDALRTALEETVAEVEANDPKTLKRRIRELEAELREASAAQPETGPDPEDLAEQIREQVDQAVVDAVTDMQGRVEKIARAIQARAAAVEGAIGELQADLEGLGEFAGDEDLFGEVMDATERPVVVPPPRARRPAPAPATARAATPQRRSRPRAASTSNDASLPRGERLILTAVAQHDAGVTREQLSVLTAYKRSSRDTYLQKLRARGLVDDGPVIVATQAGIDALGSDFEPLPTGDALRAHWLAELPQGERVVLEVVVAAYPGAVDRTAIDEATGYKRSSRDTYLQKLAARKLVETHGRGAVRASDELFSRRRR